MGDINLCSCLDELKSEVICEGFFLKLMEPIDKIRACAEQLNHLFGDALKGKSLGRQVPLGQRGGCTQTALRRSEAKTEACRPSTTARMKQSFFATRKHGSKGTGVVL